MVAIDINSLLYRLVLKVLRGVECLEKRFLKVYAVYVCLGLLFLSIVFPTYFILLAEGSAWTLLSSEVSRHVALYDADLDGEPELLAIDSNLYSNLTIKIATDATPLKFDFNSTGMLCLALYRAVDGYLAVTCPYGYYIYTVSVNSILRVYRYGLSLYNATHRFVLLAGRLYSVSVDGVPLVVGGRPAVIGSYKGYIVLYYLDTGFDERIAPLNITIVEALYYEALIYGIGLAGNTSLFFRYNITGREFTFRALGIDPPLQVVASTNKIYVLGGDHVLYSVDSNGGVSRIADGVTALFYPADSVDSFTALTMDRILKVSNSSTASEYPLPFDRVYAVDWWGDVLAASTASGIYIATTKPLYASIQAPRVVYAGESVGIRVSGVYDAALVRVGDRMWSGLGTVELYETLPPGNISVEVKACRGVFCIENRTAILVLRRPLKIAVIYPNTTKPYNTLEIFVEALDKITNATTAVSCSIRDPGNHVVKYFTSGKSIDVQAIPDIDSSVFIVSCGGGIYETVETTVRSKFIEPYLKIGFRYYGSGLLEVYGYNRYTNEVWNGAVVVRYLNMTVIDVGRALITLPPGETSLKIFLARGNTTYHVEELRVVYYEDVFEVPVGEPVILADRIKVDVYTVTETVTRHFPVYYEIRTVDPLALVATAAFTAGSLYAILMLLGKLPKLSRARKEA